MTLLITGGGGVCFFFLTKLVFRCNKKRDIFLSTMWTNIFFTKKSYPPSLVLNGRPAGIVPGKIRYVYPPPPPHADMLVRGGGTTEGPFIGGSDHHFPRILEANPHFPHFFKILTVLVFSKSSLSSHFHPLKSWHTWHMIARFLAYYEVLFSMSNIHFPNSAFLVAWSSTLTLVLNPLWSSILRFFKSSILGFLKSSRGSGDPRIFVFLVFTHKGPQQK